MLIALFIRLVIAQDCPNIYYVRGIPNPAQLITYAFEFNYIAISQPNSLYIIQAESGSYKEILLTNIQSTTVLITYNPNSWVIVGGQNILMIWALDRIDSIVNQLQLVSTATSATVTNSLVTVGTNNHQILIWNPINGEIVGNCQSLQLQNIQYANSTNGLINYDTIVIGQDQNNLSYMEYYSNNLQYLLTQVSITSATYILSSSSVNNNIVTTLLYLCQGDTILVIQILNNNGNVTTSYNPPITVSYQIKDIQFVNNYITIFGAQCQEQIYYPQNQTLSTQIYWISNCPSYDILYYSPETSQIITLIQAPTINSQMLSLYSINTQAQGTLVRSFYYNPEKLSSSLILSNQYLFQAGASTGNLYIYNQWNQQQQVLPPPNNMQVSLIIQQALLVVFYANTQFSIIQQTSTICQFSGFQCYTYSVGQSYLQNTITFTGIPIQNAASFVYNGITYLIQSINSQMIIYSYINTIQVAQTTILSSNILQIIVESYIYVLCSNDQLYLYPLEYVTNNGASVQQFPFDSNQITYNSNYIFSTNGTVIQIYNSNATLIQTISCNIFDQNLEIGINFKQIQLYNNQLLVLEDNSFFIKFCNVDELLTGVYQPYQQIQLFYFANSITLTSSNLLINTNYYDMLVYLNDYFDGLQNTYCQFSQTFAGSTNFIYVNMQNSFKSIQTLYLAIYYLNIIQAQIQISSTVLWQQIVVDQTVNTNVQLTIQATDIANLTVPDSINGFLYISLINITLQQTDGSCGISFSNVQQVSFNQTTIVSGSNFCFSVTASSVEMIILNLLTISQQTLSKPLFILTNTSTLSIDYLIVNQSTTPALIQSQNNLKLSIGSSSFQNNNFTSTFVFQYYGLTLKTVSITNNSLTGTLFQNVISDQGGMSILLSNVQVTSNQITKNLDSFFIVCLSANLNQNAATIQIYNLVVQQNIQNQTNLTCYSIIALQGFLFTSQNTTLDKNGIYMEGFQTVSLTNTSFTGLSTTGIFIQDSTSLSISGLTIQNSLIVNTGFVTIQNIKLTTNSSFILTNCALKNVTIQSNNLVFQSSGINIDLKNAATVQINNFQTQSVQLIAVESSFSVTSQVFYIQGYLIQLTYFNCTFINAKYSSSSSFMIIFAQSLNMTQNQFYNVTSSSAQKLNVNQNGGVGQIIIQSLLVLTTTFNLINSNNGAIFYIKTFILDSTLANSTLLFDSNIFNDVLSLGSGAFYLEGISTNTTLTFQNNTFQNIISLLSGGIIYVANNVTVNTNQFNFSSLSLNNQTVNKTTTSRFVIFNQCTFSNVFANQGAIFSGQFFDLTITNSILVTNTISNISTQLFTISQLFQGTLILIQYSNLVIQNSQFSNLISAKSINEQSSVVDASYSYVNLNNLTVQNSFFNSSPILNFDTCFISATTLKLIGNQIMNTNSQISVIYILNGFMNLQLSTISSNICQLSQCSSAGIQITNASFLIQNSNFINNQGVQGAAIYISIFNQSGSINGSQFNYNNATQLGGALYMILSNISLVNITNTNFNANNASQGGAIFSNSQTTYVNISATAQPVLVLINDTFSNNSATSYGGAMKTLTYNPYEANNIFVNNSAGIEGADQSAYPVYMFLAQPLNAGPEDGYVYSKNLTIEAGYQFFATNAALGQYSLLNVKSGSTLNQTLTFLLKSANNQTMYPTSGSLEIVSNNSQYSMTIGDTITDVDILPDGSFKLADVLLQGTPNTTYTFQLQTSVIQYDNQSQFYFSSGYSYPFSVTFRECLYGEINTVQANGINICSTCANKLYSFILPSADQPGLCATCPTYDYISCQGGALTTIAPGYWRANVITTNIYQCSQYYSNCTGGDTANLCAIGYVGPLCQVCDYANRYARDTYQKCIYCDQKQDFPVTQIVLTSVGVFLYLAMSIYFVAKDVVLLCLIPCLNQLLPPMKKISSKHAEVKDLNSLMKIFLAYFQIVTIVRYVTTNLPLWVDDVSNPNLLSFSLECSLIGFSNNYNIPMIYITYMIDVSIPIITMYTFYFLYAIIFYGNRTYRKIYQSSTWLVLWLFFLPNFYQKTLTILNCKGVAGLYYVEADMTQQCYGTEHFFYVFFVGIPCLIFFVFYIPVMILYNIKMDLSGKSERRPMRRYRYFYINGEFKETYYYWEFVRLAEKLLIQTIIEVFQNNITYMAESCLVIIMVYGLASFHSQPYGFEQQNFVNVVSSISAFSTIYIALVIASIQSSTGDTINPLIYFFQSLMGVINLVYIIWIITKIIIVLLPVLFVSLSEMQKNIAQFSLLRKYFLTARQRSRVLFQQLGTKIMVINIIKKKTRRRIIKDKIAKSLSSDDRLAVRRRKQTAAQDALEFLIRMDNPELMSSAELTGWVSQGDKKQNDDDLELELPEFKR